MDLNVYKISHRLAQLLNWTLLTVLVCLSFGSLPTHADRIVHQEQSLYSNIIVRESNRRLCLQFTLRRESNQSCQDPSDPQRLVFHYARMIMTSFLFIEDPQDILIIGLGGGTLPATLERLLPEARITTVEIDPAVVRLAKDYFNFVESPKNEVVVQDARVFTKRASLRQLKYDLVILDAFNGEYIPEHLMTEEYLREVRSLLRPESLLVSNTFVTSALYDHESSTYAKVFESFINFKRAETGNRLILIPNAALPAMERPVIDQTAFLAKAEGLQERLAGLDVPVSRYVSQLVKLLPPDQRKPDWNVAARALTDQYSPANLLRHKK